jgi:hypothetical protein
MTLRRVDIRVCVELSGFIVLHDSFEEKSRRNARASGNCALHRYLFTAIGSDGLHELWLALVGRHKLSAPNR